MCGRYDLHTPVEEIAPRFDALQTDAAKTLAPRYNVAPTQLVPVVRMRRGVRVLEPMHWGLVPSWSKGSRSLRPINARADSIFDKPMFRMAIRRRRCLLPADGFYEWQAGSAHKQPWRIGMADGSLFALGGIWEHWALENDAPVVSCAIVVTAANTLMRKIHDRMPVILHPDAYDRWLDSGVDAPEHIAPLLAPFAPEAMHAYPVSTRVNDVKNEGPELALPISVGD